MNTVFETNRLQLIPFSPDEAALFCQINTTPFVRKFLWDDEIISKETAQEIMQENARLFHQKRYGLWKIVFKNTEKVLGYAGLWHFFDEPQPQLLYALLEPYTCKGHATEACRKIIEYCDRDLGFDYLIAATDEAHTVSARLAERLGMKYTETRMENGKSTRFFRRDF